MRKTKSIKQSLRKRIWRNLEQEKVALFPGAFGRIPNFVGAQEATGWLNKLAEWQKARTLKTNPDSPQSPARRLALRQYLI